MPNLSVLRATKILVDNWKRTNLIWLVFSFNMFSWVLLRLLPHLRTLLPLRPWRPGTAGTLTPGHSCWTLPANKEEVPNWVNQSKKSLEYRHIGATKLPVHVIVPLPPEVYYLSELHLVHPLPRVPVQESFASKHGCKLFTNSLKQLLDSSTVANKCRRHLEPARRYVANSGLDVVRDPLDKITTEIIKRRINWSR